GFTVKRVERAQINDLNFNSFFSQRVSGFLRGVHHRGISNDAEIAALTVDARFADWHDMAVLRHIFFNAAIKKFMFEKEDGVIVANGGLDEALGVAGRGW